MMTALKPYSKAIFAGLATGIAYAASASNGGFTTEEILQSILAALSGAGVVYVAPKNAEK